MTRLLSPEQASHSHSTRQPMPQFPQIQQVFVTKLLAGDRLPGQVSHRLPLPRAHLVRGTLSTLSITKEASEAHRRQRCGQGSLGSDTPIPTSRPQG